MSCNQAGQAGKCSPYASGTDPQNECGQGTGVCKSSCDGAGSCAYPSDAVSCGNCLTCDGYGSCTNYDPTCSYGGTGGWIYPMGGVGGTSYPLSGLGGSPPYYGGTGGYFSNYGGTGGSAGNTSPSIGLHKSGCSCELGRTKRAEPGLTTPLLIAGLALLLARKRRQKG